ncbi:hypothetical protein, partial [Zoogloea sp.]|uniref:hypothetical protein n=1 Tax=Zoogloea sp. TaxID=49181 RepID=UPI00258EC70C
MNPVARHTPAVAQPAAALRDCCFSNCAVENRATGRSAALAAASTQFKLVANPIDRANERRFRSNVFELAAQ